MTFVQFIEFFGMVGSILGAFLMSRDQIKYKNVMLYAFCSFFTANIALTYVSIQHGLLPMLLQMSFFSFSAIAVIKSYTDKRANYLYVFNILFILALLLLSEKAFSYEFKIIDMLAAIIAVSGSYLLKYKDYNKTLIAFTCFFIADVLYVYVAYENSMWFFMCQSFFFWYTSIAGILNTLKYKPLANPSF